MNYNYVMYIKKNLKINMLLFCPQYYICKHITQTNCYRVTFITTTTAGVQYPLNAHPITSSWTFHKAGGVGRQPQTHISISVVGQCGFTVRTSKLFPFRRCIKSPTTRKLFQFQKRSPMAMMRATFAECENTRSILPVLPVDINNHQ